MNAPKRVLVVEDDDDIREMLGQVLADAGYAVECAANGRDALAVLGHGLPCALILLDMMMPVLDGGGFLAARRLDGRLAAIPVVIVSASAGRSRLAPYADVSALLAKPVDLDGLLETVSRHAR